MKKQLNKAIAVILALIMVFTQVFTVLAGSETESDLADVSSKSEIRRAIRENIVRDTEADTAGEMQAHRSISLTEEDQKLLEDSGSTDSRKKGISVIVPDQIIVKYKSGTSNIMKNTVNSKVSAVSSSAFNKLGLTQLRLPRGTSIDNTMDKLKEDPNVEYVEPVYTRSALGSAEVQCNDPFYTKGWQWGLEAINMEEMWEAVPVEERSQITIAIIDTGADVDHDGFDGNFTDGYDFVNNDSNADDDNGHGTHVAGIAAAAHDNEGIAGVAGGAKIMPVKVLDENGRGDTVKVINGILFAVNNGADVINLSLGSGRPSRAEEEAIQYALDRGVTVVAAAGNEYGRDVCYPAAYDGVIAVGAADWDAENGEFIVAEFSSVGPELDILAPGVDILSTMPEELDNPGNRMWTGMGDARQDGYTVADGTSMAAPFVAGMAALLLAEDPVLECPEVLTGLLDMSVDPDISYEGEDIDVPLLNGNSDINPPFSFRRTVLSRVSDSGTIEFNLSFEDYKGTVTTEVYGEFNIMMGEYEYLDGFEWINEPYAVEAVDVVNGEGSVSVETDMDKNYIFYVDATDDYMDSNPILVAWDENEDFNEAQELELDVETVGSIGTGNDEDYYEFTVAEEGYYVLESTGEIDTFGTLYDEFEDEINWDDDSGTDMNFRIDEDDDEEPLLLTPGTYYVCVEGYELGDYGINVSKQKTISGTISLPDGVTAEGDLYLDVCLYQREFDADKGEYEYQYRGLIDVEILDGQNSANYQVISEDGSDYIVQYYNQDEYPFYTGYTVTGYYDSEGVTVAVADEATPVAAGAENINLTLIPISDVDDDGQDTVGDAAPLQLGVTGNGTMDYDGDLDYYELSIEEEGNYILGSGIDYDNYGDMRYGDLYDSSEELVDHIDSIGGYDEDGTYGYRLYNLTPGTYYYRAWGYTDPFNSFEYKVTAKEASVISGTVSLPEGVNASLAAFILVIAEDSAGNAYVCSNVIGRNLNNCEYALGVPPSGEYVVSYYLDEYYEDLMMYAQEGYYSTGGTKTNAAYATKINASNDVSGINLELIPLTDKEGDHKGAAKQITSDTLVEGRIDDADDADYYKFTVPTGGGYYNIDIQSQEDISIYLYDNDDWILYDEGYESSMEGYLAGGIHYLMVRAEDDDYGSYSFTVSGIHKPLAKSVSISGIAKVGSTLTGRYTYYDGDSDTESGTAYRWLRSDTSGGTYSAITGATGKTYKLTQDDLGKYIKYEVTPRTNIDPVVGVAVKSSAIGPIRAATSSGGHHGSGGGGGGGGANNSAIFEQTKAGIATINIGADGRTTVGVEVSNSGMERALTSAGDKPVILDVSTKAKQDNLQVNIPSSLFSEAAKAQKPLVVNSNNASFNIEPGTFDAGSLNRKVKLGVSQLSADSVKDIVKNKDAAANEVSLVFDFDISIGGSKVTSFNKPVTITVKYDISKATDLSKVGVYYYNEKDSRWEYVGGKANPDGTITFSVEHFSKYTAMEYKKTFADINGHWAKSDIELLIVRRVARSENETSFAPDSNITRASFASMLVKALDIRGVSTDKVFTDVPSIAWYKDDVYQAYAAGIIDGVSSSNFAPDAHITREQMAAMLMRAYEYVTGKKLGEIVTTMNVRFNDESGISGWARRNVILANATGLMTGNPDGAFNPKGNTTKAQAVTVVKRLMEKLKRL